MKSIETLIRLHKQQLDKIVQKINETDKQKDFAQEKLRLMQVAAEEEIKYHGTEYGYMLESYLENAKKQQKTMEDNIKHLQQEIDNLRIDLQNKFSELKKFEIILERKKSLVKMKIAKQEENMLDEVNTNRYINS